MFESRLYPQPDVTMDYVRCELDYNGRKYNLPDHFSHRTLASFCYDAFQPTKPHLYGSVSDESGWLCDVVMIPGPTGSGKLVVEIRYKVRTVKVIVDQRNIVNEFGN